MTSHRNSGGGNGKGDPEELGRTKLGRTKAAPAVESPVSGESSASTARSSGITEQAEPSDQAGPTGDPGPAGRPGPEIGWKRNVAESLAFLRRRLTGEYEIDDFGYDPDFTEHVVLPPLRLLYEKWFRVETVTIENVPATGGALLVANHSGTLAVDALMLSLAVHDHHPAHRPLRMLGADLVFDTPILGPLARRAGNTLACNEDAQRLLDSGESVSVFPEGFKGVGKPFSQRYKLQRFGRGGFVSAAVRARVPIVPCAIVGAEEIYPMLANVKPLARALGLPYFPVTPTFPWLGPLGAVPLPSKWLIEFGDPIPTDHLPDGAAEDPMVVFNLADRVRETIQQSLYRLLLRRGHPFLG